MGLALLFEGVMVVASSSSSLSRLMISVSNCCTLCRFEAGGAHAESTEDGESGLDCGGGKKAGGHGCGCTKVSS